MQLHTEITPDELAQAMRLNRTKMYWPKVLWANWYGTLILVGIEWAAISRLVDGKPIQPIWLVLLLAPPFILWFYWSRTKMAVQKAASNLSEGKGSASIDGSGLHTSSSTGATSFLPWSEFSGWKEGTDVFILTQGKSFRAFTKRGLSDAELEQLRSILRSQIS